MNKQEELSLIDGCFDAEEAKEILMNIFSTKIEFHRLRNFSYMERFGTNDEKGINRIPVLKQNIEKVLSIIDEAKKSNKQLLISSNIDIQLTDRMD